MSLRTVPACMAALSVAVLAACTTPQERVQQHEDLLAAAGFVVRPANTARAAGGAGASAAAPLRPAHPWRRGRLSLCRSTGLQLPLYRQPGGLRALPPGAAAAAHARTAAADRRRAADECGPHRGQWLGLGHVGAGLLQVTRLIDRSGRTRVRHDDVSARAADAPDRAGAADGRRHRELPRPLGALDRQLGDPCRPAPVRHPDGPAAVGVRTRLRCRPVAGRHPDRPLRPAPYPRAAA